MLRPQEYPAAIAKYGVNKLTPAQTQAHEIITEMSGNYTDWPLFDAMMEDPDIKKVVNNWLTSLEKLLAVSAPPKPDWVAPAPKFKEYDLVLHNGKIYQIVEVKSRYDKTEPQRYAVVDPKATGVPVRGLFSESALTLAPKKRELTAGQRKRSAGVSKRGRGLKKVKGSAKSDTLTFAQRMKAARDAKKATVVTFKYDQRSDNVEVVAPEGAFTFGFSGDTATIYGVALAGEETFRKIQGDKKAKALYDKYGEQAKLVYLQGQNKPEPEKAPKSGPKKANKGQKAPITPKPAKPAKLTQTDAAYLAAKQYVKALPVEVKHYRKYVKLAKEGTKAGLIEALNAIQRDIRRSAISKTTPTSDVIMRIQGEYVELLSSTRSTYRPSKFLELATKLAEETKVYKTTEIMLAIVGWNEADKTAEQCKKLLSTIRNAKVKGKIKPTDPYAAEVDQLQQMLELATTGKRFEADRVDLAGLRGLAGLAGLPGVKARPTKFTDRFRKSKKKYPLNQENEVSGLGDIPAVPIYGAVPPIRAAVANVSPVPLTTPVPAVMSSADMMRMSYETYKFKGDWLGLIGQPSTAFKLMIWGEPGMGKSTLAMLFARYLALSFGQVLYCSSEEFPSYTLNEKVKRVGGAVQGWDFSKSLMVLGKHHKFLVLDSLNHFGWTLNDLRALAAKRPDLSIIMILQATKEGQFKGGKDIEHEVDTVIHAYAPGQARTTKNRFAKLADITTF